MVTNIAITAINVWFLTKEFRSGAIDLGVSAIRADSPFLLDFIRFHTHDIGTFQPDFAMPVGDDVLALLLTREGLPAGVLIGHQNGDTLTVDLDYVLAAYRDSRLGDWLYGRGSNVFRQHGIAQLRAEATTDIHDRYLHRMGFKPAPAGDPRRLHSRFVNRFARPARGYPSTGTVFMASAMASSGSS